MNYPSISRPVAMSLVCLLVLLPMRVSRAEEATNTAAVTDAPESVEADQIDADTEEAPDLSLTKDEQVENSTATNTTAEESNSDADEADEITGDATTSPALAEFDSGESSATSSEDEPSADESTTSTSTEEEPEADKIPATTSNGDEVEISESNATSSADTSETAATSSTSSTSTQSAIDSSSVDSDMSASTSGSSTATSSGTSTTALISTSTSTAATTTAVNAESATSTDNDTSSEEPVTIVSGEAIALANIINLLNTNFVNSDGVVFFGNYFDDVEGAIDLRSLYDSLGCSLEACAGDASITSHSTSTIINSILLQAISGQNKITDADRAAIESGDAYAGLNLINVANMNFVDSNYLLVTINAFGDVNNDIVFPSASTLLSNLANSTSPTASGITVDNDAVVTNQIDLSASSGGNAVEGAASSSIVTGESGASSNIFNQLNSTLGGGQSMTILFRVHGDWAGDVFGAPTDLRWAEGPDGSLFLFDVDSSAGSGSHTISATNNAGITNDVQVVALTGENRISGAETGAITTGNAYAGANIVNLANGTVVGRNWILAIVNIFGDFNGNIAFGRPDLWVGQRVSVPEVIESGSRVTYTYTVLNNGDAPATNVKLRNQFDSSRIQPREIAPSYSSLEGGEAVWELGTIPPGGGVEVRVEATLDHIGEGEEVASQISVSSRETDNQPNDNHDTAVITGTVQHRGSYAQGGYAAKPQVAAAAITSDASAITVERRDTRYLLHPDQPQMRQLVTLRNPSDADIAAVTFTDILKDAAGNIVQSEVWDLGTVLAGEEITLGYTLAFNPVAPGGAYIMASRVQSGAQAPIESDNGFIWFVTPPRPVPQLAASLPTVTLAQAIAPAGRSTVRPAAAEPDSSSPPLTVQKPSVPLSMYASLKHASNAMAVADSAPARSSGLTALFGSLWQRVTHFLLSTLTSFTTAWR